MQLPSLSLPTLAERGPWISLLLLILAATKSIYVLYLLRYGKTTTGMVTALDKDPEGDETPIVSFIAADQKTYTFRVQTIRGKDSWFIDKICPVRYDPRKPTHAHVDEPIQRWMSICLLLGGSVLVFVVSRIVTFFASDTF